MDRRLERLTWPQVDALAKPVLVVPIGSTEQHGPHLPLSTDTIVAAQAAAEAVDQLCREASATKALDDATPHYLLAPALPYGNSGEHEDFPGTISIGATALHLLLVELGRSASRWARGVVFVNGHGGNSPTGRSAATQLRDEGRPTLWLDCQVPDSDAHAGATETGLIQHLEPDLMQGAHLAAGTTTPLRQLLPALQRDGVRAHAPSGVLGDPRTGSAAAGARDLRTIVAHLVHAIIEFSNQC